MASDPVIHAATIQQLIEQLESEARRWEAIRKPLSSADPQAWWVLTAGEALRDAAHRLKRTQTRAERAYGPDVLVRVDNLLRAARTDAPGGSQP